MAGNLKVIANDAEFSAELANAGARLVLVDFFATWCGPCRNVEPIFVDISSRYPKVKFMKVDIDKCNETSHQEGVSAVPTFIFYRNKVKIEVVRGDASVLEDKIKEHDSVEDSDNGDSPVKGHMDLLSMINKSSSECLNESDDHTFEHCLTSKGGYLESDCDEQLIIHVGFTQTVKLHSLRMHCSEANGPKTVKVFFNQPHAVDFDSAESMEPLQLLELKPEDLQEDALIPLKFVKLQNVVNITLFVKDNQSGDETTRIDYLSVIGSPTSTTNMADFKRVAGKAGESH